MESRFQDTNPFFRYSSFNPGIASTSPALVILHTTCTGRSMAPWSSRLLIAPAGPPLP